MDTGLYFLIGYLSNFKRTTSSVCLTTLTKSINRWLSISISFRIPLYVRRNHDSHDRCWTVLDCGVSAGP